jgi:predicted GNAT superfamily acetyltransferase
LLVRKTPIVPERIESVKEEGILVRPLQEVEEMSIGVDIQRRVWGHSEIDTVPGQVFVVAHETGGQVLGAFQQGKAIGFALAFVGAHRGAVYLHSHMVGVLPEFQDRGVGRLLKLAQRDDAIARGIDLIEWTFDPLQLKNAHFNLERLGAIVRRYIPDCYGRTSSPLHAGLPTYRLVAEWWIRSPRVHDMLGSRRRTPEPNGASISVPAAIRQICNTDPSEAERVQARVREQFQRYIAQGHAAVGFAFDGLQGSYIVEPYED